jgi:hypothetical protein
MLTSQSSASYDVVGVAATPATLTAAYTGNTRTIRVSNGNTGPARLHLDFKYTPKAAQTDRYAYILIEVSNDDGVTFFPMTSKVVSTDQIDAYIDDLNGANGIPILVPGDLTSTGGTAYSGNTDHEITATHVKISAKETGVADFGTLYVRATVTQ